MRKESQRLTVTLEEDVVRWARAEAEKQGTSVSVLLAQILKERMIAQDEHARAMRSSLARKPFGKSDGKLLSRDELHDRTRFR
jgi:hypothetical protein